MILFLPSNPIPHPVLPRHTRRPVLSPCRCAAVGARAPAHPALRCACTGLPQYHPFGVMGHRNRLGIIGRDAMNRACTAAS